MTLNRSLASLSKKGPSILKELERLKDEGKQLEEKINQLNENIESEKQRTRALRAKYPFIDGYIHSR